MFTNLLVTLDGSRGAEAILPYVIDVSKRLGAAVTLMRVVNTLGATQVSTSERGAVGRPQTRDDLRRKGEAEARDYLERQARNIRCFDIHVEVVVRSGDPAHEIVTAASECGADTIAMATHSRRGLDRLMLGSVAERVLHSATVPLVLVRVD